MSDAQDTFHKRVEAVRRTLGVEVCTLYRVHADERALEIAATSGLNPAAVGARLSMEQGLTGKVARTAEPLAARDIHNHPDHYHVEGSGEERFRSYLGIPLLNDEHLLGVLVIQTELTRTFFRGDIRELHQAGQAVLHDLAAGKVAKAG